MRSLDGERTLAITRDPTHIPLSETLASIRQRAGYSILALAEYLEVDAKRIADFEAKALPDSELMEHYGHLARLRTP